MGVAVIRRPGRRGPGAGGQVPRLPRPGRPGASLLGRRFTLPLVALSAVTLVALDVRGFAPIEGLRGAALNVVAPVGDVVSGIVRPVRDTWSGTFSNADLARQNDELHRRVQELEGQVAQQGAAQDELVRLKAALDLPDTGALDRVTARVTSAAIADFDLTVEIDKGSDDGIAKGMPAVVGTGLVGSVAQVSGSRAIVRLVTDRGSRVGVTIAGRTTLGLVEGQGDTEGLVRASNFDVNAELPVGAQLVTAGTPGSLYPPAIPVGTVERVELDGTTGQKVAEVRLASRLDDLMYVTVLRYRPEP